jgi:hypothetical protein
MDKFKSLPFEFWLHIAFIIFIVVVLVVMVHLKPSDFLEQATVEFEKWLNLNLYKDHYYWLYKLAIASYYTQSATNLTICVLFFVLFPRDQAFYILMVLVVAIYFDDVLNMLFAIPCNFIYYGKPVPEHIDSRNVDEVLRYAFPLSDLFIQVIFDTNIYLTAFHTSKFSHLSKVQMDTLVS